MKKVKYLILIILVLLSFNVKAAGECKKEEQARLKELAKKVEFDYDYKLVDDKAVFSISAINLNSDLKVLIVEDYYALKYKEFKDNGNKKGTLDNFKSGEKVTVTIKGYVANWCSGKTVLTKTVKLPYYNYFYDAEKCKGNEDFKYCKQLIDSNITRESFDNQFAAYLKNKEAKQKEEEQKAKDNTVIYIIIGVISGILAIGATTMIILNIRKKNSL